MHNFNYWARLKKACEFRGLDVNAMSKLVDEVRRRASGDRDTAAALNPLMRVLEPPQCGMNHCQHYGGAYHFCNCGKDLVPGRCKINREFQARQTARMEKIYLEGREYIKANPPSESTPFKNPYDGSDRIEGRDKAKIFKSGATDEWKGLPLRDVRTRKLKLEWGVPTLETLNDFYAVAPDESDECKRRYLPHIAAKLELERCETYRFNACWAYNEIIGKYEFIVKGKYPHQQALKYIPSDRPDASNKIGQVKE